MLELEIEQLNGMIDIRDDRNKYSKIEYNKDKDNYTEWWKIGRIIQFAFKNPGSITTFECVPSHDYNEIPIKIQFQKNLDGKISNIGNPIFGKTNIGDDRKNIYLQKYTFSEEDFLFNVNGILIQLKDNLKIGCSIEEIKEN